MERWIVAVNVGSSSRKYALYRDGELACGAHFEHTENGYGATIQTETRDISQDDYEQSLTYFLDAAKDFGFTGTIDGIGVRIVAPGGYFAQHRLIDEAFMHQLKDALVLDSVHLEPVYALVEHLKEQYSSVPMVAVSDSAFHQNLPPLTYDYALPTEVREQLDLHRFGYHGIALEDVARQIHEERVVVCHLGSGASVAALRNGVSVEHSMGYSPLEGLPMSSRSGDVDPGAIVHMVEKLGSKETRNILYEQSGLLGVSGLSHDMRVLLANEHTHEGARQAIALFTHRVAQYVARSVVTLGGIDALVFSGTIGLRSALVRAKVGELLRHVFPIELDEQKNENPEVGGSIAQAGSIPVYVCHADETREIARVTADLLQARG